MPKTGNPNGMNWITQSRRLAIYLRDGLACVYCDKGLESVHSNVKLTLDHLLPRSQGGSNHECNLVTCCAICNSRRSSTRWRKFAAANVPRILRLTRRTLDVKLAKQILESRQNFREAILASTTHIQTTMTNLNREPQA